MPAPRRPERFRDRLPAALVAGGLGLVVPLLAAAPYRLPGGGTTAWVQVSYLWVATPVSPCRRPTPAELARYLPHIAKGVETTGVCARPRRGVRLTVRLDDRPVWQGESRARGVWHDGAAAQTIRLAVRPGCHRLALDLAETGGQPVAARRDHRCLAAGQVWILDLAGPRREWVSRP